MRYIEVRELCLQNNEVMKGLVKVVKIPGEDNPGDLMTKLLHVDVIRGHLLRLNLEATEGNKVKAHA